LLVIECCCHQWSGDSTQPVVEEVLIDELLSALLVDVNTGNIIHSLHCKSSWSCGSIRQLWSATLLSKCPLNHLYVCFGRGRTDKTEGVSNSLLIVAKYVVN